MRVLDEDYCESTWWRLLWEYLMQIIMRVLDEDYCESTCKYAHNNLHQVLS
jgi:hypothetical protein